MFMYDLIFFLLMYLISFHLIIDSDDWFLVWLGLEVNMMMFIVIVYQRYSMLNVESCMKYFFIQSLGSAIFMVLFYYNDSFLDLIMCLVLGYKMGAGPFFFWFPSMCEGISWLSCFVLMSFQKIIPLVLVMMFFSWIVFYIIMISLVLGVIGSFNQVNLKRLLAYSSVYHLGWIFVCMMSDDLCWVSYLVMYMYMMFPVVFMMKYKEINSLLMLIKDKNKLLMMVLMLSLAGMPPFLGFFLKWFVFINSVNYSFIFMLILVVSSIIMFYVYFRIVYDVMLSYFFMGNWKNWVEFNSKGFWIDLLSMVGVCLGMFVAWWIMF